MRSDDERDKCIDLLISRVNALENEVAQLKGEILVEENISLQQDNGIEIPETKFIPKTEPKRETNKALDSSLESAIGTRWIGRIGVLAILFGVAFFLKYSFDNKLIGETGRVILGIFWGAVFIGAGEYLQKKKNLGLYGQMLSGCGLAVLYLALYAAFALYHLIPASLAAACMLAVTTTGMTLSIRYTAYSLAAIAILGGFLTPIMLSTGQNQPMTLFGYILLLDMGTLLLMRFRQWPSLVVASLFGTALLYFGWHSEFYNDAQKWLAFGVILMFFIFYNLYILISRLNSQNDDTVYDQSVIFGSALFFFLAFFHQYHGEITWPVKLFTLSLAVVEIWLAMIISQSALMARISTASYAIVSIILTVIATFIILEQRWIMPALTAEMVALGFIGLKMNLQVLRRGAYLMSFLVLIRFAYDINFHFEPFQSFIPILNGRFLVCSFAIVGLYIFLYAIKWYKENLTSEERNIFKIIFIIIQALSLILFSIETYDYFRSRFPQQVLNFESSHYAYQLSLSILWALYASILTGVGILKRIRGARILGILLLSVTVLKVFLMDLSSLQTFYRIISFVVLGLLLLAVSYGYNRFKHLIFGEDEP
ncbi:MAG: hypothetical protein CVU62_03900 [Deltaproteobacteria bacterium HGW-Deltaproteobacteria-2]|jgi:uncharacterized membrane protein|nr:MAG: hypothetical protein CVU62_03900 [Deltaproteobacteria bacterium HGW-Deltaproteobacteria-2]